MTAAPQPGPLSRWIALGLGCAFFALYALTASPGLFWMDSGELTSASYGLGVAHPPGFPLYTLLGKAATLIPFGSIAFRVVLLSAACGALTVAVVFWLVVRLALALGSTEPVAVSGGIGGAAVLGVAHTFWRQATVAEVYTPSVLLVAVTFWMLLETLERRDSRMALALAFVAGLAAAGAHPTYRLLVVPPLLVAWVVALRGGRRYSRAVPFFFGLGALVLLYLTAVAGRGHVPDWGSCTTLGSLWDHLTARRIREASFEPLMFSLRGEVVGPHLGEAVERILSQFVGIALPLAFAGAWCCQRPRGAVRWVAIALLVAGVGDFVYSFWINPMGLTDLQNGITTALVVGVLAGVGIAETATWIGHRSARLAPAVAGAVAVMVVLPTGLDALAEKVHGAGYGPAAWVDAALEQAPPRAVVLTSSDDLSAGLVHAQVVEGARPDVLALVRQHLWVSHYLLHAVQADRDPELPHGLVREYATRPREARQRSRLNLLAMLVDSVSGRRPLLWEPGDGADLAAVRRPLVAGVPLFTVHAHASPPTHPAPAALVARVRTVLRGDSGIRAARVRARHFNALGLQQLRASHGPRALEEARQLFALALKAWPRSIAARVNGGVVLARLADRELAAGREAAARRLLESAARVTEKALAAEPNRYTALLNAGRFRLRLAQQLATLDPEAARVHAARARRHFLRARLLYPLRAAPHFHLGVIAARAGRFPEAARHFRKAVELDPRDKVARSYLERVERRRPQKP